MTNFKLIIYVLSFTLSLLGPMQAFAYTPQRGNVHTILGPYFFKTNYDGIGAQKTAGSGGPSWIILGDVSDQGALEITTTFMNKMYFRKEQGLTVGEKAQLVHVSLGYRYWLDETYSTSASLYTSYPLGDSERIVNELPAGQEITTTAQENSETGLDFGLQAEVWSQGRYALVLEGRYSWSLTKKPNEFADQYGALIGIRYFFQGKNTPREK